MLDPGHPLPLYVQLRDHLAQRIQSGQWAPGDRISTEMELMDEYCVGRATVRQALSDLVARGMLCRKQGKGTFVNAETGQHDLELALSYSAEMLARGIRPGAIVLKADLLVADRDIRERLGLRRGQKVLRLDRIRTANGNPVALEQTFLNYGLFPGIEQGDFEGSLYQLVTGQYKTPLIHATHTINAALADERFSRYVHIPTGSPVLVLERVTFTRNNLAVDFVRFHCRTDLYRVSLPWRAGAEPGE